MLFSLLANLAILFSLLALPLGNSQTIDVSALLAGGQINLIKTAYPAGAPYRLNNSSLGMKITAQAAMVVDKNTDLVLWQKNSTAPRVPASITKLLTALVFLDHNPGWAKPITVTAGDYRQGGRTYIYAGEQISLTDLFNIALVASANSATVALARATGLSAAEFTAAMNAKAAELGMNDSTFTEPTGLDPQNVSTAADIIKLARAAFARPEIRQATVSEEYNLKVLNNGRTYTFKNTDKLLAGYLDIQAGKTGYLDEAGYCLVSEVLNSGGHGALISVLGSATDADRFQDLKALAQWAFDNYRW
ncbi:MAG: serine hydrolase [Candidatus Komeilibacteria bacterium]|nr:serine hydrolase [Candidatus Komeilibacteria bacterium]